METTDVFIAYHGTYDEFGSLNRAKEVYDYLEARGVNCYFFPEQKSSYFAETPIEVKKAGKFLLVCNNHIQVEKDGSVINNGIKQELQTFWNCIYEGKRQRGDARVYSYGGFTSGMANELHIAFQGVAHFDESHASTEECFKEIYEWITGDEHKEGRPVPEIPSEPVQQNPFALKILNQFKVVSNIFTLLDLDFLPSQTSNQTSLSIPDLSDLVQLFQEEKDESSLSPKSIISKPTKCIVYGEGGSGKTTFLQHKAYEVASQLLVNDSVIPIFIKLAECNENTFSGLNTLLAACGNTPEGLSYEELYNQMSHSRLILFLDGLDEYAVDDTAKASVLFDSIRHFSGQYNCSVIVTCRTKYLPEDSSFQKYKISPLTYNLVMEFIRRYFEFFKISLAPDAFLSSLPQDVQALTCSPLILSMVIAQYYTTKSIPSNKDELYEKIMTQLLLKKPLISDSIMPVNEKFYILCYLAFSVLLSGKLACNYYEAVKTIEEKNTYNIPSERILDDFIHSGIISKNDAFISFFHSSVLDYFASQEVNREYSFTAKATMDQYFLRNEQKINSIIQTINPSDSDEIIEVGAGIGSVSLHLEQFKKLYLIDLDEGLCKILNYNFRHCPNCEVIQDDAIKELKELKFNKVISNLPFFLSTDVLSVLKCIDFEIAVMSVKEDDDLSDFNDTLKIEELELLTEEDFFPKQPFKSRLIKITKRN